MVTPAQVRVPISGELADLIYQDEEQSRGVGGNKTYLDKYHLVMRGGIEVYERTNNAADLDRLKNEMVALHPDRTMADTAAQFIEAHARYSEALLKSKE